MCLTILGWLLFCGLTPAIALESAADPPDSKLVALEREIRDSKQGSTDTEFATRAGAFRERLFTIYVPLRRTDANEAAKAQIESLLGTKSSALEALDEALRRNPNDPRLLVAKGQARLSSGDYAGALAAADVVLGMSPPPDSRLLNQARALRLMSVGRGQQVGSKSKSKASASVPGSENKGQRTVEEVIAEAKALPQTRAHQKRPLIDVQPLRMTGGLEAAPEASATDRLMALLTPDDERVAKDIATLRRMAARVELPSDTVSLGSSNLDAPKQFLDWLRNVQDEDLPPISYGIIRPGLLAQYNQSAVFPDSIRINYFIRDAEAETRATALVHEIYHHWDISIAGNPVPGWVYNHHSKDARRKREYDAYQMTRIFWAQNRPSDAASPASRSLDAISPDSDVLRHQVDEIMDRGDAD